MKLKIFSINNIIKLMCLTLLLSCSKSGNIEEQVAGENEVLLNILVSGIEESGKLDASVANASAISNDVLLNIPQEVTSAGGYSMEIYAGHIPSNNILDNSSSIKSKISGKKLGAAMESGVKYRIIFYEIINGTEIFFKTEEITTGSSAFSTTIKATKNYKWYAYSYNDATMPAMVDDLDNPVIPSKTDAPLLMASGTIAGGPFNAASKHLAIVFKHKVSKVELIIDAANAFATAILALNVNFQNFNLTAHNFDLRTGQLSGSAISTQAIPTSPILFESTGATGYESSQQKSTNSYYTSSQLASIQFKISLLTILKYGTNTETVINSNNVKTGTVNYTTPLPNTRLASVNVQAGAPINGTIWSTGNLYYDQFAADPFKYRFQDPVTSGQTAACNHYFQWNSKLPRNITGGDDYAYLNSSYVGDPCAEVYPKGTWKTPSTADFTSLQTALANSPRNGAVYFEASNGERVNFHEAGWLTSGSNACPNPSNTDDGLYWSTTQYNTNQGLVLEIDERGGTGAGNEVANYNKRYGMSVRCIKK